MSYPTHFMLHPTASSSDPILLSPPSHTTAQYLSPGTSQHLLPHRTYANDTLCGTMRAIQSHLSKTPSVSSRTTCPVQRITSVALDAPSLMLTTYMEPSHVSWSLHPTHPHGYHRTHPWNFSGTTPESAALHSRKTRLKGTLSVKTPPRPCQHPLPPHRQHRFPLRFRSSILRCHLFHRHPLTLLLGHSNVGKPRNHLHSTRLSLCLVPSATE